MLGDLSYGTSVASDGDPCGAGMPVRPPPSSVTSLPITGSLTHSVGPPPQWPLCQALNRLLCSVPGSTQITGALTLRLREGRTSLTALPGISARHFLFPVSLSCLVFPRHFILLMSCLIYLLYLMFYYEVKVRRESLLCKERWLARTACPGNAVGMNGSDDCSSSSAIQ